MVLKNNLNGGSYNSKAGRSFNLSVYKMNLKDVDILIMFYMYAK